MSSWYKQTYEISADELLAENIVTAAGTKIDTKEVRRHGRKG